MTETILENYVQDAWVKGDEANLVAIPSAVRAETVAKTSAGGLDFAAMAEHAREVGGPALRAMTFHARARMLKSLGLALMERKAELYALSLHTGATPKDGWVDIEGGAMTLFSVSSKAKRELPDDTIIIDGATEALSKRGSFIGHHIYTSKRGVAVQINAFNFPVWGMLEKLGPALMAGMPVIVKPATPTAYITEAAVRIMTETGLLPDGAVQLVVGSPGDLLDHLGGQDVVSFTGSARTANMLKSKPNLIENGVTFIAEQDSLNASVLGPDATAESPELDLFVKEVVREMTVKAGQKCTAIRRVMVPAALADTVEAALKARLSKTTVGDPALEEVRMGALVSEAQRKDVVKKVEELREEAKVVFGSVDSPELKGEGLSAAAYLAPILLRCDTPSSARRVHSLEAFGPVATILPYDTLDEAIELCRMGGGSLVMSLFTHDPAIAKTFVREAASFHGRVLVLDRDSAKESTGHGSPLPVLTHGGPGRAGGGEEMGGIRGVKHYMQRTSLQGSPDMITAVTGELQPKATTFEEEVHPFRLKLGELAVGRSFLSGTRTISLEDIEHFAHFTGDTFYAHMDEEAATANPFFPGRVAHGYLILSFAAGLFVDPAPGPVLANYGLDDLRFLEPVSPGDAIQVRLSVKSTKPRKDEYGEVRWAVEVTKQDGATVATYTLLTMNAC